MSLEIRYLTNGEREIFTVRNEGVRPPTFDIYDKRSDIDVNIRHYAPEGNPVYCSPALAEIHGVQDVLYPNHPKCVLPKYADRLCVTDGCKYFQECGGAK